MGDSDDFDELYADLDDRVIVGVLTAETEEEDKNEIEERRVGFVNGAMESGSSSDSDDDLRIVLNEEDYSNKLSAQLVAEGRDCEDDGDGLVILTGLDCSGKESKMVEQVHSADGLLQGNGDQPNAAKGAHRNWSRPCLAGSAVRPRNSLSRISHFDHLTVPCYLGKSLHDSVFPSTFPNGCDFYLPQNRSIFNIDVESFEYKPWRFNGVDITDYFNFGLDEEGWRTYCKQLAHFQQNNLPLHESSRLSKSTGIMSGEIAQYGCENSDYLDNGRKGVKMPKGQAIQVESGNGDRLPSMDVRRPRNRDSDVVIQITTGPAVEDPIIKRLTHMDDNRSKNEIVLNSKNKLCESSFNVDTCACKCEESSISSEHPCPCITKAFDKKLDTVNCDRDCPLSITLLSKPAVTIADHYSSSSKSSDHNDSFEASMDEVKFEKVPRPECIHLNSDNLLQEPFLPCWYPSSETGDDTNKTVSTSCGGRSPEFFLDLNYCQQTTPCQVVQLNLSSEDDVAFPLVHEQKIDVERQAKESGTVVKQWDDEPVESVHSIQESKILLKNNIKYNSGKEVNAAAFSARSKGNDEEPPLVRIREKMTTVREIKTSKNGFYNNRRAWCSRAHGILKWDSLQSTSLNMSLHDKMVFHTRSADGHGTVMRSHYNSTEAKDRHNEIALDEFGERSLDKNFGRCVSYLYEEEGSLIDKYDSVPCGAGAFRRLPELDNRGKTQPINLKRSSEYVYDHEDSRFYEERLHSRIYREAYDEDKRSGHEDGSHKHQLSTLLCRSVHSHTRETFSQQHSKHDIIISKKSHHSC
ncbi:uncharacterized protein LOC110032221 [Phalaenopsis equestris]|uniref:uncharacterized protein LOC110032221 n=1 Tax=Phalaenopsis equestris TaxID=78828 RepID=UPI0009E28A34|nr:uncharacterized protein LOC110032221 [Phalaenopsis equestris]